MDGVTILQVITSTHLPDWIEALQIFAVIIGAGALIFSIVTAYVGEYTGATICFGITIICILVMLYTSSISEVTDITYRVLVDDTVNMNEFFSKYELIRTEGLIYVVREISGV